MPNSDQEQEFETYVIKLLATAAGHAAAAEVMSLMIKQEARDLEMISPDRDKLEMYKEAARRAEQRMVDTLEKACNGRCTGA